jgi:chemotaxis protein MotB
MLRRDSLEDSDNHERWLVSYADFVTLLFGFFVVMYAISSVNEGKYRVLSSTLTAAFESAPKSLDPIQLGEPLLAASPHLIDVPDETGYQDEEAGNAEIPFAPAEAERQLQDVADIVKVRGDQDWLELSLDANVLFTGGDARLSAAAANVLRETAAYLAEFDNPLTIEGHTDNVPSSGRYPSNWDLSAARAAAVANFLVAQGLDRRRLATVGYGENHPLATNATPEGRAANRRVVIVVARKLNTDASDGRGFAFAAVRAREQAETPEMQRTSTGGLLFSNDPADSEPDASR